jgi:hypothetical protein
MNEKNLEGKEKKKGTIHLSEGSLEMPNDS